MEELKSNRVVVKLEMDFTPKQLAAFKIEALNSKPEYMPDFALGGPMPPAMRAENKRKAALKEKRILEIIKEHGVAKHYLKPLRKQKRDLEGDLAEVNRQIAALEKL